MRITLESDYALRIVSELAKETALLDANTIAERTSVTQRFALKILRKLVGGQIVSSFKGAHGGYKLRLSASEITLKKIIELIDGPIAIVRCLESNEVCSMKKDKTSCIFHHIFDKISFDLAAKLEQITIADVLENRYVI